MILFFPDRNQVMYVQLWSFGNLRCDLLNCNLMWTVNLWSYLWKTCSYDEIRFVFIFVYFVLPLCFIFLFFFVLYFTHSQNLSSTCSPAPVFAGATTANRRRSHNKRLLNDAVVMDQNQGTILKNTKSITIFYNKKKTEKNSGFTVKSYKKVFTSKFILQEAQLHFRCPSAPLGSHSQRCCLSQFKPTSGVQPEIWCRAQLFQ